MNPLFSIIDIDNYFVNNIADTDTCRAYSRINKTCYNIAITYLRPFFEFFNDIKKYNISGKWRTLKLLEKAHEIDNINIAKYIYTKNKYVNLSKLTNFNLHPEFYNWLSQFNNLKSSISRSVYENLSNCIPEFYNFFDETNNPCICSQIKRLKYDDLANICYTVPEIFDNINIVLTRRPFSTDYHLITEPCNLDLEWCFHNHNKIKLLFNNNIFDNNALCLIIDNAFYQPYYDANFDVPIWIASVFNYSNKILLNSIIFASYCYKGSLTDAIDISQNSKITNDGINFGFRGACINGHVDIVKWILQNFDIKSEIISVLRADLIESEEIFELLIKQSIMTISDIKMMARRLLISFKNRFGDDNFYCKLNFLKIIDNAYNKSYAFELSCCIGLYKDLDKLNVNYNNKKNMLRLLRMSCQHGHIEILKLILNNINIGEQDIIKLLEDSCDYDMVDIFQYLILRYQHVSLALCFDLYSLAYINASIGITKWIIANIFSKTKNINVNQCCLECTYEIYIDFRELINTSMTLYLNDYAYFICKKLNIPINQYDIKLIQNNDISSISLSSSIEAVD